jgi:hypothetical protein
VAVGWQNEVERDGGGGWDYVEAAAARDWLPWPCRGSRWRGAARERARGSMSAANLAVFLETARRRGTGFGLGFLVLETPWLVGVGFWPNVFSDNKQYGVRTPYFI